MEKKDYLTTILAIGLVITTLILALNAKTQANVPEEKNKISVSGMSSITVEPNKAEIYVKIATLEKTAQDSKNKNSQISSNVMKALKKEGVKDKDFETSQFSIYPKYEYEEIIESGLRKSKQVLVGYEAVNVLKVTTQDLEKAGKLIDVAVDNGANDIERVAFGLTKEKEKEAKEQAMVLASNDAREKAVALATNIGVSLVEPISISESSFVYRPFEVYAEALFAKAAMQAETVISPQKLEVSASINLVYEIR